jgi:sigma-E factor negative regulatory protein RseA
MKETLSAWMDSELSGRDDATLLPQLQQDAELRRNWDCYHLIGDALRGVQGADVCASVCARIDAEPTVLAPQRRGQPEKLRWAALSLAASVAAVAFVGWIALSGTQQDAPQVAVVAAPQVQPVAAPAGEAVNDYLLAHQRYSPSNAMQGVAPYVRTVAVQRGGVHR